MVVNDARTDERFCDNPLVTCDPNIRFYAGYPISAPDGSKMGTLCIIDSEPREISAEDRSLLRELGRMVEEELIAANMARNDPVTGLSNRLGFSLIAEHLLGFCTRNATPASLLAFHLCNLKDIDDDLGHAKGDRAAAEFAHTVLASFRDSDVVGRIAPDVFAVLLGGVSLDNVTNSSQRLQDQIGERNRDSSHGYELLTTSRAVTYNGDCHPDVEALIADVESRFGEPEIAKKPKAFPLHKE